MQVKKHRCEAKTRDGSMCRNWAMDNGRCRMHGGMSTGAPEGNKNAVTTGEHETITYDDLTEEERELYHQAPTDVQEGLESILKLALIRTRRLMHRINQLEGRGLVETESCSGICSEIHTSESTLNLVIDMENQLTQLQRLITNVLRLCRKYEPQKQWADDEPLKQFVEQFADESTETD